MKELTPFEQLDNVLNYINDNKFCLGLDLHKYYFENNIFKYEYFNPIILKLLKDNYISYFEVKNIVKPDNDITKKFNPYRDDVSYDITFEGRLFIANGGYKTQAVLIEQSQKAFLFREKLIVFGSIGAAFGTIGLLTFELLKYLHNSDFWNLDLF